MSSAAEPAEALRATERGGPRWAAGGLGGLALAVLVGPAGAQTTQASDVALFEMSAPDVVDFTLHGTIPVPKGTFPRADGLMPFSVRDVDGTLVPAQVEPVTWYPDKAKHGADVVEIIAQVERPANYTNHDQVFYEVVAAPVAPGAPSMTPTIQAFLAVRDSLVLKTRDAFGNVYDLDLRKGKYGVKTLKSGRWQTQTRYYGVMKPDKQISGPTGTLNHLFGVHAYVTTYAGEDFVQLDLRVHNGMSGLDKLDPFDDPNDNIYFDSLDLVVPDGWTVIQDFTDPMLGAPIYKQRYTTFPLVKPNADGTLHVFPQQSQMHRRLVVTPVGNESRAMSALREQWLAFVRMGTNTVTGKNLYSWWAPATSRYFPQKTTMPDLAHIGAANCRSELTSNMNFYAGYMASGQAMNAYPLHSPRLGWAHPWGVKYGGMTSGQEIYLYDGMTVAWGASCDGYRLAQLQHRMYSDRHPTVIYNKDGEPTQVSDWLEGPAGSQYVHMNFYMRLLPGSNDPFGFTQAPVWQINHVKANNLDPTYESELLAHENIDMQHLIRYTHCPKVLMWTGNDALAKDDLRMQAEIVRLSYHPHYVSPNKATIVSGMLEDIQFVAANPNIGFPFGRGEAWAADTMATAYAMADDAWRAAALPWFDELTDLVWSGQSTCNGFIQAQVGSKLLNGNYRARQSIEQAMIENALFGVNETVFRDVNTGNSNRLESVTLASVYAMIGSLAWDPINDGPHSTLAVGPLSLSLPLFCTLASFPLNGTQGGIDAYQTWSSFAYGYQLSGDEEFLSKGFDMTGGTATSLNKSLESTNFNNLENRYALLSMSQRHDYP